MTIPRIRSAGGWLAAAAVLLLAIACSSDPAPTVTPTVPPAAPTATVAPATPTPTPAPATPTPAPAPTVAPTATLAPATPTHEPEYIPEEFNERIALVREKMAPLEPVWTVYFHSSDWLTPGENTLMGEVFELLKMENIANHEGYREIAPETVVAAEPDIIIADSVESIVDNPALSGLHMAQDADHIPHHIFVLDGGLSFDPDDHHFMDAVEELAAFVYPDVFVAESEGHGHSHDDKSKGHSH